MGSTTCRQVRQVLAGFGSRFWQVGTEAVDAFTVDRGMENNYLCPHVFSAKGTYYIMLKHVGVLVLLLYQNGLRLVFGPYCWVQTLRNLKVL